jgi:hypothetical protein
MQQCSGTLASTSALPADRHHLTRSRPLERFPGAAPRAPSVAVVTVENMTTTFGIPAAHARSLARRAAVLMFSWGSASGLCAALAFLVWNSGSSTLRTPALAAGSVGFVVSAVQARKSKIDFMRAYSGVEAEKVVATTLKKAGVAGLVNGAVLEGGDADHVVFGPSFAVIETKHGRGNVRVDNGVFRVGTKALPRDPVAQVLRQVEIMTRIVGRRPVPIVCVPGMVNNPFETRGVLVCSVRDLGKVVRGIPFAYDEVQAVEAARRLHERSQRKNSGI